MRRADLEDCLHAGTRRESYEVENRVVILGPQPSCRVASTRSECCEFGKRGRVAHLRPTRASLSFAFDKSGRD